MPDAEAATPNAPPNEPELVHGNVFPIVIGDVDDERWRRGGRRDHRRWAVSDRAAC